MNEQYSCPDCGAKIEVEGEGVGIFVKVICTKCNWWDNVMSHEAPNPELNYVKLDTKYLRRFFEKVCSIVDLAEVKFTADGLKIESIDPSHVVIVKSELSREVFDVYSELEDLKLDVPHILKFMKDDRQSKLIFNDDDTFDYVGDRFEIANIKNLDEPITEPSMPPLEHELSFRITPDVFNTISKRGNDQVIFELVDNKIKVYEVDDLNDEEIYRVFIPERSILTRPDDNVKCMYPHYIFPAANKILDKKAKIVMYMNSDYPTKIEMSEFGGLLKTTYIIAPRIPC